MRAPINGTKLDNKKLKNVVLQQLYVERCTADLIYTYIRAINLEKIYCQCFIQTFYNFSLLLLKLYNLSTMSATCSKALGILQAYLRHFPKYFANTLEFFEHCY